MRMWILTPSLRAQDDAKMSRESSNMAKEKEKSMPLVFLNPNTVIIHNETIH
jgi:hypothetical protein